VAGGVRVIVLHLPFPPSVNNANGFSKRGYYPSAAKDKFFRDADSLYMTQKRGLSRVDGPFTYHIVLNKQMRHGLADGDNRLKYVLDYAQRVELIENDKLAEGGSWSWGECEHGAMLSIHPVKSVET
jgi:Holliday junction resolvase RusA-like endonuclease